MYVIGSDVVSSPLMLSGAVEAFTDLICLVMMFEFCSRVFCFSLITSSLGSFLPAGYLSKITICVSVENFLEHV